MTHRKRSSGCYCTPNSSACFASSPCSLSPSFLYRKLFLLFLLPAALFSCFLDIHTRLLSPFLSLSFSQLVSTPHNFFCAFLLQKRHFLVRFSSVEIFTLASTPRSDSRYRSVDERESFFVHIFAAPLCSSESVRCLDDHSHPKNFRLLTFLLLPLPPPLRASSSPPFSSFLLSSLIFLPRTSPVYSLAL